MSATAILEGDLGDRLLPAVLGEIQRRNLEGRFVVEAGGKGILDLRIAGGAAAAAEGAASFMEKAVGHAANLRAGRFRLEPGGKASGEGVPLPRLILVAARSVQDTARVEAAPKWRLPTMSHLSKR